MCENFEIFLFIFLQIIRTAAFYRKRLFFLSYIIQNFEKGVENMHKIKAIIFADTHNCLEKKATDHLLSLPHDLVILLGDISNNDWKILLSNEIFCKSPKIAVAGNHDDGEYNWRINQRIKEKYGDKYQIRFFDTYRAKECKEMLKTDNFVINNISFNGISGSVKYKNIDSPYLKTQKQALDNLRYINAADILISHDKPKAEYDDSDTIQNAHSGLYAIWYYMQQYNAVNIHGHIHEEYTDCDGNEYSFFRTAYLEIRKKGLKKKISVRKLSIVSVAGKIKYVRYIKCAKRNKTIV